MARLQEEVEMALRDEVEARVSSALSEEEVMQVTHEVWATFYSHTLQYHLVSSMPSLHFFYIKISEYHIALYFHSTNYDDVL